MTRFLQLLVIGITEGGLYAIVAVSMVLVYKSTKVVSLVHGQFIAYGALAFWFAFVTLKLPFVLALLIALVCIGVLGWLIERFTMRPLIGQPLFAAFLNTFAIFLAMDGIYQLILGGIPLTFSTLLSNRKIYMVGIPLPITLLAGFCASLLIFVCLASFYRYTRIGLEMRATAEDNQLAQSTGILVRRMFSFIWIISALVATFAGMALANVMDIYHALPYIAIKGLIVAILGGLESLPGALLAGLILGVLENVSAGYLDPIVGGGVKEVAAYIFLLLILLIKPYGLFGLVRIERI